MAGWPGVGTYKDMVLRFWHWSLLFLVQQIWMTILTPTRATAYGGGRVKPSGNLGVENFLGGW